jgi:RsiW-degrading membrane proteinase PrsW (M82 family)
MNFMLALYGAVPALLAMYYVDRLDAKRPEPRSSLRKMALLGGLVVIPVALIELGLQRAVGARLTGYAHALFVGFIVAGVVEEGAKVICVRAYIWHRPEFDERLDGIVYATRVGLGFALVENVAYLLAQKGAGMFVVVFLLRAILAVPGHAIYAGIMGYFAGRKRFDNTGPGMFGGFVIAVLLHGGYDAAIFSAVYAAGEKNLATGGLLMLVPFAIVGFGAMTLRKMVRVALAADDAAEAAKLAAQALLQSGAEAGAVTDG